MGELAATLVALANTTGGTLFLGVDPGSGEQLGWVDDALARLGKKRRIRVFTRHYQAALKLAELRDLVVTLPARAAALAKENEELVMLDPPFDIPEIELKMAWSPLLQHNPAHRWLREMIVAVASDDTSD